MKSQIALVLGLGLIGLPTVGAPVKASADTCIQISGSGCDLSGALGFFRFKQKLPKNSKKLVPLHGRACGVGPAFGTAVVDTDEMGVELGATFFCDAVEGQFDIWFPVGAKIGDTGSGYASYGRYDVVTSCDAEIVDCGLEP